MQLQQTIHIQRAQNALARSVVMTKKNAITVTPVLARLHRLPVTARIQFEIALLTFKTLTTHQPSYIRHLLQLHCSSRQLRSASHNLQTKAGEGKLGTFTTKGPPQKQ